MTAAFILLAALGAAAAQINFSEIMKDPSTKGWGVGLGLLAFAGFGLAAIWTGA
jgi:hypothetical protein